MNWKVFRKPLQARQAKSQQSFPFLHLQKRVAALVFTLLCFAASVSAKSIMYVRVSFQECNVAMNFLSFLENLPLKEKNVQTIFVFKKEDAPDIKRYKEKYLSSFQDMKYTTTTSDKLYNRLSTKPYSTVHLFINGREMLACALKELGMNWRVAEGMIYEEGKPREWKNLSLPKVFVTYPTPSSIYLYEPTFNDIYYLNKVTAELKRIIITDEEAEKQLAIFFEHYPEKKRVHDSLKPITKLPPFSEHTEIASASANGDTLFVFSQVRYLENGTLNGKYSTFINSSLFISAFYKDSVLYRKVIEIPQYNFWMDELAGIGANDSFYFFSVAAKKFGT